MDVDTSEPTPGPHDKVDTQLMTSGLHFDDRSSTIRDHIVSKDNLNNNSEIENNSSDNNEMNHKLRNEKKFCIIHLKSLPIGCDYDALSKAFGSFGNIGEIKMRINDDDLWEAWISFSNDKEALDAICRLGEIKISDFDISLNGALCGSTPRNLDIYRPSDWCEVAPRKNNNINGQRKPKPPMWLLASVKDDSYNFFKTSRYIQKKIGSIKSGDITRFGKNTVLIHAKSKTQSVLLSNLRTGGGEITLEIKPHNYFSYGRGVIFNSDLYEFDEDEILEMCPKEIWKVQKMPNTSMIVLSFENPDIPYFINIENERVPVKPFKQRPLQCFKCFRFGHPSRVCHNTRLCSTCSGLFHEDCRLEAKCINCNNNHKSTDKICPKFKIEEEAINKSLVEHITIGYAKRLLNESKNYSKALKQNLLSKTEMRESVTNDTGMLQKADDQINPPSDSLNMSLPSLPDINTQPLCSKSYDTLNKAKALKKCTSLPNLGEDQTIEYLLENQSVTNRPQSSKGKTQQRKRERPPSPSLQSRSKIATFNKFDVLTSIDSDGMGSTSSNLNLNEIEIEIHEAPKHIAKGRTKKTTNVKPTISRQSLKFPKSLTGKTLTRESSSK